MEKLRIATVQNCPNCGDLQENKEKILGFMRQAAEEGAGLMLLPEASLTGYRTEQAQDLALDSFENEASKEIRGASRRLRVAVCFGYIEKREDSLFITQELCAEGRSIFYRKTHLGSREQLVFAEGNDFPVLSVCGVTIGMQLCWESHIPEISGLYREQGAELLLVPYASGMSGQKSLENWNVHLPARASDNGVFLAACNLLSEGVAGEERRGGGIAVYDPKGRRICESSTTEEIMLLCDLEGQLPRELPEGNMHTISYFDRKRKDLFRRSSRSDPAEEKTEK